MPAQSARRSGSGCAFVSLEPLRLFSFWLTDDASLQPATTFDSESHIYTLQLTDSTENVTLSYTQDADGSGYVFVKGSVTLVTPVPTPLARIDVFGNGGYDTITYDAAHPVNVPVHFDGGEGNDTLNGGSNNDWLVGGPGDDVLYGLWGADALHGDDGDDRLDGAEGDDALDGGSGNDTLLGGTGYDVLYGGTGADAFDKGFDGANLLDFNPGDTLAASVEGGRYAQSDQPVLVKNYILDQAARQYASQFGVKTTRIYTGTTSGSISSAVTISTGIGSIDNLLSFYSANVLPAPTSPYAEGPSAPPAVVTYGNTIYSISFGDVVVSRADDASVTTGYWADRFTGVGGQVRARGLYVDGDRLVVIRQNTGSAQVQFSIYSLADPEHPAYLDTLQLPSAPGSIYVSSGKLFFTSKQKIITPAGPKEIADYSIGWYRYETEAEYRARLSTDPQFGGFDDGATFVVPTFSTDEKEYTQFSVLDLQNPSNRIAPTYVFGSIDFTKWTPGRLMLADAREVNGQRQTEIVKLDLTPGTGMGLVSSAAVPGWLASENGMQTGNGTLSVVTRTTGDTGWDARTLVRSGETFWNLTRGVQFRSTGPATLSKIEGNLALVSNDGRLNVVDLSNTRLPVFQGQFPTIASVTSSLKTPDGRVLLVGKSTTQNVALQVLDARNGTTSVGPVNVTNRTTSEALADASQVSFLPDDRTFAVCLGSLAYRDNLYTAAIDDAGVISTPTLFEQGGGVRRTILLNGNLLGVGEATITLRDPASPTTPLATALLRAATVGTVTSSSSPNLWLESQPEVASSGFMLNGTMVVSGSRLLNLSATPISTGTFTLRDSTFAGSAGALEFVGHVL